MMGALNTEEKVMINILKSRGALKKSEVSFSVLELRDQGSFGKVYKIRSDLSGGSTGDYLAMKSISLKNIGVNRELRILKRLNHPNVVKLLGYYKDQHSLKLLFPLSHGDLYSILKFKTFGEEESIRIMAQIFEALAYLHGSRLSICHRDVKPKNVLMTDSEGNHVRLCDFGSATEIRDTLEKPLNWYICSRYYRAPELLLGSNNYDHKIDVWSSACVWSEILTGEPLFWGETSADQIIEIIGLLGQPSPTEISEMKVENNPYMSIMSLTADRLEDSSSNFDGRLDRKMKTKVSDNLSSLFKELFSYSPLQRPSSSDILRSKVFYVT